MYPILSCIDILLVIVSIVKTTEFDREDFSTTYIFLSEIIFQPKSLLMFITKAVICIWIDFMF